MDSKTPNLSQNVLEEKKQAANAHKVFLEEKLQAQLDLERDRCERFGLPFDPAAALEMLKQKQKKTPLEQIKTDVALIQTFNKDDKKPVSVVKTCLKTITLYTGNVVKHPNEPKYMSINMANKAFQERVGQIRGGLPILKAFGFEEDTQNNKLTLKKYDAVLFQKGIAHLEDVLFKTYEQKEVEMKEARQNLKKQLSQISFTHEDEPEKEVDFWDGVEFDQSDFDKLEIDNNLSLEKISHQLSRIHTEEVKLKYKYVVPNGTGKETVFISGQFNNWDYEEMKNNGSEYIFEKSVKGGQIYNFYLFVDGQMVVDDTSLKTPGGKANWIFVPMSEKNMQKAQSIFEKPLSLRIAKLNQLNQEITYLGLQTINGQNQQIQAQIKQKQASFNKLLITINQDVLDRFVFDTSMPSVLYKVIDFIPKEQKIKFQQLFDQNGLLLNWKTFTKVQTMDILEFTMLFGFVEKADQDRMSQQIYHTSKFHMFIKYYAQGGDLVPMEIRPNVNINHYEIKFDHENAKIAYIKNQSLKAEIMFQDLVLNEVKGYVTGAIVDIWTQTIDFETLNIIHFHVNDTSDEVTLDVSYMHEGENLESFYTFKSDFEGRPLKYKIIVKDCRIFKVLYNESAKTQGGQVHEIPFQENVIEPKAEYISEDMGPYVPRYFGMIENVPTGMISSADMNKIQNHQETKLKYKMTTGCHSRGFQDLLGYIDFKVLSIFCVHENENEISNTPTHQIQDTPSFQAMSICCLQMAQASEVKLYKDTFSNQKQSNKDLMSEQLKVFSSLVAQANTVFQNKQSTKEEDKAILEQLQSMRSNLDDITQQGDIDEELQSKYEEVQEEAVQMIGKLVRRNRF